MCLQRAGAGQPQTGCRVFLLTPDDQTVLWGSIINSTPELKSPSPQWSGQLPEVMRLLSGQLWTVPPKPVTSPLPASSPPLPPHPVPLVNTIHPPGPGYSGICLNVVKLPINHLPLNELLASWAGRDDQKT